MSKVGKSHCEAKTVVDKVKYAKCVKVPEQNRELFFNNIISLFIISPPNVDHLSHKLQIQLPSIVSSLGPLFVYLI